MPKICLTFAFYSQHTFKGRTYIVSNEKNNAFRNYHSFSQLSENQTKQLR